MKQTFIKPANSGWRYCTGIAVRIFAAIVIGYATASAFTVLFSAVLPFDRVERVFFATLLSFAVWTCAAIYVFAAKTAWRSVWLTTLFAASMFLPTLVINNASVIP